MSGQFQRFVDCLASRLADVDDLPKPDAVRAVEKAFWTHLVKVLGAKRKLLDPPEPGWTQRIADIPGARTAWHTAKRIAPMVFAPVRSLPDLLHPWCPYRDDFLPAYQMIQRFPGRQAADAAPAEAALR
jgi:hypothetical protein